jgi:hypothetical protein
MSFEGSLAEIQITDLIQLVGVSRKTGALHIRNGSERGEVYLVDGQVVHAQLGPHVGEEAVYAMVLATEGDFEFEPGDASPRRTISKGNTRLLMEAAQRVDEWRVVSRKVPSTDLVPEYVTQPDRGDRIFLNTAEWLVLAKIDGRRSVRAVAGLAGLTVFDTAKVLYGLVSAGLIRLKSASPPPLPASPPPPPSPPPLPSPLRARARVADSRAPASRALLRLARVRDVCNRTLGSSVEIIVNRHCDNARSEIQRGGGPEAVWEAVDEIAQAAYQLRGEATAEALLEQLSTLE